MNRISSQNLHYYSWLLTCSRASQQNDNVHLQDEIAALINHVDVIASDKENEHDIDRDREQSDKDDAQLKSRLIILDPKWNIMYHLSKKLLVKKNIVIRFQG